eukprot:1158085-Pelagomonas_calceolata.AAC.2
MCGSLDVWTHLLHFSGGGGGMLEKSDDCTRRKGQKGSRPLSSPTQQPQAMPPLFFSTADLTANVQKHHRTLVCEDSSTSSSSMADQAAYPKEMDSKIVTWPA